MGQVKEGRTSLVVQIVTGLPVVCFTDQGQPAVFCEAAFAEGFAAQLRDHNPTCTYRVIDFLVL